MAPKPPKTPRTLDAQDIVTLTDEWKKELVILNREVTEAVTKLEKMRSDCAMTETLKKAVAELEKARDGYKVALKSYLPSIVVILALLALFLAAMWAPCFTIEVSEVKLIKHCEKTVPADDSLPNPRH